ncbi:mechanosensitive ion channel protein MscS [Marinibacterium profundimaris]|uniref:Mechanosensitive ion channel protein MscS n=2 Tax=Marinibacterium profundimaris TaxID=1679460 RepID=A0A225ND65_9RHOB|nr:mechanosensitive ion channel protein MscS [Marinibacterium profundimaris]
MARVLCAALALGVICLLLMADPGRAQTLPGLGGGGTGTSGSNADSGSDNLASALRQAAEAGVSVVVLDPDGSVLGASSASTGQNTIAEAEISTLMQTYHTVETFVDRFEERLAALPVSVNEVLYILRATSPDGRIVTYAKVLFYMLVLLAIGRMVMVEVFGKRLMRRFVTSRILEKPRGYSEKVPFLVMRFLVGMVGTVLVLVLVVLAGFLVIGNANDLSVEITAAAILLAFFLTRTVGDLWRMILSPYLPQYRIPRLTDREAQRLYFWVWGITAYGIWTGYFATWIKEIGLNYNVYAMLSLVMLLIAMVANVAMVLVNRKAITRAILHGRALMEVNWATRTISLVWAPALVLFFVFAWLRHSYDLVLDMEERFPLIAGAYAVFLTVVVVYAVMNYALERYFDRVRRREAVNRDMAEAEASEIGQPAEISHRPMTYEALFRQVAGILAFAAGSYALVLIWLPENKLINDTLIGNFLDVAIVLFMGYIVYNLFRIWIDNMIAQEEPAAEEAELGDEGGATGASRLATLLPLFRGAILAVVVVTIGLIALMELGVNVGPLFAGAGVVGIAIGFGAQTLVRDIFSGAFFLIDDAFRKGEYIDIGIVKGTVEKISVRSFQLRHHLGALQTVPFGEVQVLTNFSRDWVIMKLPLRVTYDTDVEKVRKLIKKLGQQLLEDPVIGENFIQPLKSQGVIEMQDSAMIIRVKFMTKPGDQWLVRKKVYEEIRALFAREGIRFAHREVTVRLADENAEDLTPKQRDAVVGAVQTAIEEEMMDEDRNEHGDDR